MDAKNKLSAGEIATLKQKYGVIFEVTVIGEKADEPDECFYFKKANMTTVGASLKFLEADPLKASMLIFNDTLVHGRQSAVEEPNVFLAVSRQLQNLLRIKQTEIKEL